MADIRPFCAVLPDPARAGSVCAPPYDVVTREEARRLAAGNPYSFLRVSRADLELPDETAPDSPEVFERARRNYLRLKRETPYLKEASPFYYVYRIESGSLSQTGIVAVLSVSDYRNGIVRRHEKTRPEKVEDRARHILALRAQTGPVFLAFRKADEITAVIRSVSSAEDALFAAEGPDGARHTLWRVPIDLGEVLRNAFGRVPAVYIADGHHRAESASRVCAILDEDARAGLGSAESPAHRFFLGVIFPAHDLHIMAYNRVLRDLGGRSPEQVLAKIREETPYDVAETAAGAPEGKGCVHMALGGRWWRLTYRGPASGDPVQDLDVARLQRYVLAPIFGIEDPRTDPRIDFVGGRDSVQAIQRELDAGRAEAGFALHSVTMEEVMAVADAGRVMPPKSTWFEPKLADGLFIHEFD